MPDMDLQLEESNIEGVINDISSLRLSSDQKLQDGLRDLSNFPQHESLQLDIYKRKLYQPDLQSMIENQQITYYRQFQNSLGDIKNSVDDLHSKLVNLNNVCVSMSTNLGASKQSSRNLIEEISKLESERKKLVIERDLAQAYSNAFQLNAEDIKVLKSTDNASLSLSKEFFQVFEKIQRIQSNVNVLLKIGHQTTAVEILDQMGLLQETALEKIYRWSQANCKNVENPEISDVLAKSLSYLQVRPMLLKYVLDEYCMHRRSLVVRSFIDALTGAGNVKGIELTGGSDPARYIGDMLAWIHQTIPNERENLLTLLRASDKSSIEEKVNNSMSAIMDGVCRPLNVRMEQTILSGLECAVMNKIDMCIQFYVEAIQKVLPGSNLVLTLSELSTLCHQTFINQLRCMVQAEVGEFRSPGPDLTASQTINVLLSILEDLLKDASSSSPEQASLLIQVVVNPLVNQINEVAARLGSPDNGVYLCNCLNQIKAFLDKYPICKATVKGMESQIDFQLDRLSSEQSSWLVAQLGIGHMYAILNDKMDVPLSTLPGMDPASLKIFMNKLDNVINDPESVLLPQLIHLSDMDCRKNVEKQSFKILSAIYKQMFEAVKDPKNGYPQDLVTNSPEL